MNFLNLIKNLLYLLSVGQTLQKKLITLMLSFIIINNITVTRNQTNKLKLKQVNIVSTTE